MSENVTAPDSAPDESASELALLLAASQAREKALRGVLSDATDYIAGGFIYGRPAEGQDPLDMLKDRLRVVLDRAPGSDAALREKLRDASYASWGAGFNTALSAQERGRQLSDADVERERELDWQAVEARLLGPARPEAEREGAEG